MICKYRTLFLLDFYSFSYTDFFLLFFLILNFSTTRAYRSISSLLYSILVTVRYFSGNIRTYIWIVVSWIPMHCIGFHSIVFHCVSLPFCTALFCIEYYRASRLIPILFLLVLLLVLLLLLTSKNKSKKTIGYFAIWGCVLCTVLAIFDTKKEIERLYI